MIRALKVVLGCIAVALLVLAAWYLWIGEYGAAYFCSFTVALTLATVPAKPAAEVADER